MAQLEAEHARLSNLPATKPEVDYEPTGETVAERWAQLDQHARRAFLREYEIKIYAQHGEDDGSLPMPDFEGSVRLYVGNGLRIEVRLGDTRRLRLRARPREVPNPQ